MRVLNNETHLSDAEDMASSQSERFLNDALDIINKRRPDDEANCKVVLASLIISKSILFVGKQYISALVSAVEDIAERIDCAGAGTGGGVADSETIISLSEKQCIFNALMNRWVLLNPEPTSSQISAAENRFKIMAGL